MSSGGRHLEKHQGQRIVYGLTSAQLTRSDSKAVWAPAQVNETNLLASRHYAAEGRCFVIAVGALLRRRDLALADSSVPPEDPDALLLDGATTIIGICTPDLLRFDLQAAACSPVLAHQSSSPF